MPPPPPPPPDPEAREVPDEDELLPKKTAERQRHIQSKNRVALGVDGKKKKRHTKK